MGQRLGKSSWTTTTSSNCPRDINQNQSSVQGKFKPCNNSKTASTRRHSSTETIDNNSNQITSENIQIVDSTKALLRQSASSSSLSSSPPGQVIIRIQLTKMENNNNINSSTENLDNSLVQSNVTNIGGGSSSSSSSSSASSSSSRADNESIYSSFDNNLNITCGRHSIINLTISNNIPCNAPITTNALSNNLNIVSSTDRGVNKTSSSNTRCLNIVGDRHHHHQQPAANLVENNLNRSEKSTTGAQKKSSRDRSASKCLNTNSNSGRRTLNANFNSPNIIPNISSNIQMVADTTKVTACCGVGGGSCSAEQNCNSGHSSLCSESSYEGHRGHCCHSKNFAYPSKLRCCQCVCRESRNASNNNSNNNHNVPSATSSTQSESRLCYRNTFQPNVCCTNGSTTAVVANRQPPPADMPPPPSHQIIVVQVNPELFQHSQATGHANLAQNFPQDIGWILPALCSSATTSAAGPAGVQGVPPVAGPMVHSQADYSHCLVPDLEKITKCTFYWGKMDRYEAERLLDGKPEGTFLLRDSAQEEYLFSVTFRKYGRSLHARIEQLGHKFSFDCHDPGVFTASTVTGLLEHYKDPSCVMFFEPTLTIPLHRNFSFSLQQLCRATTVSHITYDGINELQLPSSLKSYLKEYHYKYKVRETPLDDTYQCS